MLGNNKFKKKNKERCVIVMGEEVLFQLGKIFLKKENMSFRGKDIIEKRQ